MSTIYEEHDIRRVVNACGRMTALGVSTIRPEVGETLVRAAGSYVVIDELIDKVGGLISKHTGGEDSCVTVCASAGIMIATAACIARDNIAYIEKLPDSDGLKNEIVMMKGHAVNFNASITQMIRLGGGIAVEAGQVNKVTKEHLEAAVTDKTAALFYCKSHHCVQKGMASLEEIAEVAHRHNLPVIVDAAAEEDLRVYLRKGGDLVIYSGAKAIEGPSSGFITGKREYIGYCKKQYKGVGRAAKIGKEGMMGIVKALELYENRDHEGEEKRQLQIVEEVIAGLSDTAGLTCSIATDDAGRKIYRARLNVNAALSPLNAEEIAAKLKEGNPAVYIRDHFANIGVIFVDPRPMLPGDAGIVIQKIKELLLDDRSRI